MVAVSIPRVVLCVGGAALLAWSMAAVYVEEHAVWKRLGGGTPNVRSSGCVNTSGFASVTIISLTSEGAAKLVKQMSCGKTKAVVLRATAANQTGCARASGVAGCYDSHLRALAGAAAGAGWHLILEDDAIPGWRVLEDPSWFARLRPGAAAVVNLGPNDVRPSAHLWLHHFVGHGTDMLAYLFGGRTPVLGGFGTLAHAYAVTDTGALLLLRTLGGSGCRGVGIDTDMRDLRHAHPGMFLRVFDKDNGGHRAWGMFSQSVHVSTTTH
jgi:hypothetical protein